MIWDGKHMIFQHGSRRGFLMMGAGAVLAACVPSGGYRSGSQSDPAPRPVPNAGWDAWVQGFKARAAQRGISPGVIDAADLPERHDH